MNCKIAAQWISRSLDEPLKIKEQEKLQDHLNHCPPCDTFQAQLQKMQELLKNSSPNKKELNKKIQERMQEEVEKALKN